MDYPSLYIDQYKLYGVVTNFYIRPVHLAARELIANSTIFPAIY